MFSAGEIKNTGSVGSAGVGSDMARVERREDVGNILAVGRGVINHHQPVSPVMWGYRSDTFTIVGSSQFRDDEISSLTLMKNLHAQSAPIIGIGLRIFGNFAEDNVDNAGTAAVLQFRIPLFDRNSGAALLMDFNVGTNFKFERVIPGGGIYAELTIPRYLF